MSEVSDPCTVRMRQSELFKAYIYIILLIRKNGCGILYAEFGTVTAAFPDTV